MYNRLFCAVWETIISVVRYIVKKPPFRRHFRGSLFALFVVFACVLALLICDAAAGFASGLAGCLAFAAAAVFRAVTQIACFDCLDMLHDHNLQ